MRLNFSVEHIKSDFFQKKPTYIKNAFSPELFSWQDLDELLYNVDVNAKTVRLAKNGLMPESAFLESTHHYGLFRNTFNKSLVYKELDSGATLILNRIEQKSLRIKRLCNQIALFAKGQVVANGYFAKTGSSAFGNHWDSHDVFASQLLGSKRWIIYPPTFQDPIAGQKSVDHVQDCPQEACLDVITMPGDILYIPRGWWHCAYPSEGPCFHVAVGVHKPYIIDYLNWINASILARDKNFRKGLDLDGKSLIDASMLEALQSSIADDENLQAFEEQIIKKEKIDNGFNFELYCNLSEEFLGGVSIKLASPFRALEKSISALPGVEGVLLLAQHLSTDEQSLAVLRSKVPDVADEDFFSFIRTLISSEAVFVSK